MAWRSVSGDSRKKYTANPEHDLQYFPCFSYIYFRRLLGSADIPFCGWRIAKRFFTPETPARIPGANLPVLRLALRSGGEPAAGLLSFLVLAEIPKSTDFPTCD